MICLPASNRSSWSWDELGGRKKRLDSEGIVEEEEKMMDEKASGG